MKEPSHKRIRRSSPAKLNLGLEVLGPRGDGYHDIATIFLAIDLQDTILLEPSEIIEAPDIIANLADADNLALRALHLLRQSTRIHQGATLKIAKRIPFASGLGGASSNAAAALLAGCELWSLSVPDETLWGMARDLGSDVPFFLKGGCALGTGRGDILQALTVPDGLWFAIVVPNLAIPRKTATLFAHLTPEDFGDGRRLQTQASRLAQGQHLDPELLTNAFTRPLYDLRPSLADLPSRMQSAGAPLVALSGAGPAHYSPFSGRAEADAVAARLRADFGASARVFVAGPIAERSTSHEPL